MKVTALLGAWFLWQNALLVQIGTAAAPQHLRFEREILLPAEVTGPVCAALDAEVLAHTASAAHNDLRVFRAPAGGSPNGYTGKVAPVETPYLLTESGPEPVGDAEATVAGTGRTGDSLHFDLHMPVRAYTEVDLRLRLHDFVGTAVVSEDDPQGRRKDLGTFGIFDLAAQRLGQWTALGLAETSAPVLHVVLTLRTPAGKPIQNVPLAVVAGAAVPPSRERQTVFTPVAMSRVMETGNSTVALLHVPAHVPIERIRFRISADYAANYWREVYVRARTDGDAAADTEVMDAGAIQHVRWAPGDPRLNPIDVTQSSVEATTGATLAGPATVRVAVSNGEGSRLPIQQVALEMRERRVCFLAAAGARYTLRYGDPALAAPVYDVPQVFGAGVTTVAAGLGPEQRNPAWRPRRDQRAYLDRHPEAFWLLVLLCGGMMGGTALQFVQHREQGGRG